MNKIVEVAAVKKMKVAMILRTDYTGHKALGVMENT